MAAIAHQIAIKQPDLVSLQEVTTWRVGPGPNPRHVEFDMLQELLDALAAQGLHYNVVMKVDEFDLQAPLPDLITFVEAQDRDVLLARADEDDLQLSNAQKANFATLLTLPTLAGSFTIVQYRRLDEGSIGRAVDWRQQNPDKVRERESAMTRRRLRTSFHS